MLSASLNKTSVPSYFGILRRVFLTVAYIQLDKGWNLQRLKTRLTLFNVLYDQALGQPE